MDRPASTALERARMLDVVIFDKTGTLTRPSRVGIQIGLLSPLLSSRTPNTHWRGSSSKKPNAEAEAYSRCTPPTSRPWLAAAREQLWPNNDAASAEYPTD